MLPPKESAPVRRNAANAIQAQVRAPDEDKFDSLRLVKQYMLPAPSPFVSHELPAWFSPSVVFL
jgi:hypothetical protein